jgi:hypothetical protein
MPESQRNIVWIASYPKSGNTWVRFIACNLLYGRQGTAATLGVLAPDIHEAGLQGLGAHAGLVKTHFLYSTGLPLAERTAAAIYVVRHPADVLASNFHYAHRSAGVADDSRAAFDRYVDSFLQNRGDPRWVRLGMGSWEDNVRSWLGGPHPFPVLHIRYEDMVENSERICRMLAQALRPGSTDDQVREAAENSSFRRMRAIEEADIHAKRIGIFYKPYLQDSIDAGRRFMRHGTAGGGADRLTSEQRACLSRTFAPLLEQLGYPALN